jgi:hypothetical protein
MRLKALLLVVILTMAPIAEAWSLHETAGEPCPMAAALRGDDGPCFSAPCPCDHSSQAVVTSQGDPTALPRAHVCAVPAASARPAVLPTIAAPARGFPRSIDRPPTSRA